LALDAKINFDDNALFRHKDVVELRDLEEEDPKEIEASGMSGFHEIEFLSNLAQPDIAVITNIGESHMQDLGSR
ncbi:hypothetical protein LB335_14255, partial [Staphylococcus aureus]|uniref:Mur ligase family protein n=1 Tax=Staphylococcus aureus TaxID=1280 RepID=UPI0022B8751D